MNSQKLWLLLAALLYPVMLTGQFYSTGSAPASHKWNEISTDHYRIIFPRGLLEEADSLVREMEYYLPHTLNNFAPSWKRKTNVILHNTSVLSNGYVTLAPRRMELVLTPPQDSYAQKWTSQLVVHESRHVAQLSSLNQGFTRYLNWIGGEIGPGMVSAQMPTWFYEGDAVYNETRLSEAGRGRIPGFEMPLRTLLMENEGFYNYDKAVFGSYRNFVPDIYCYGYQLTQYAREKHGPGAWSNALSYTARHPYLIWPLALYMKKQFGTYKSGLYRSTMDSLKKQYYNKQETYISTKYSGINKRENRVYTDYKLPKDLGDGLTLAYRKGLNQAGSFVVVEPGGNVRKLFNTGRFNQLTYDVHGAMLVWDEIVPDPRWERRDYSVIMLADLRKNTKKALTRKSRYFSPDISPDGNRIAVIEIDEKNRNFITLLDLLGKPVSRIPAPPGCALQLPEWTDMQHIAVVAVTSRGKQIVALDLANENWSLVLSAGTMDISEPVNYKNYILFRGSFNGIENIYAVNKSKSEDLYQVTFSTYGAYFPAVSRDSSSLLFSDYTSRGFDVTSVPLDPGQWVQTDPGKRAGYTWKTDSHQKIVEDTTSIGVSGEKPYRKTTHLFRFHSWLPFFTDVDELTESPEQIPITPGVMIFSQNMLSTLTSSLGYSYDKGYHKVVPTLNWRGWYPVFEFSGQLGGPSLVMPLPEEVEMPANHRPYYELTLKSYIPLVFNKGAYSIRLQPGVDYQQSGIWHYSGTSLSQGIDFIHFRTRISRFRRPAARDFLPAWGQSLSVTFTETILDKGLYGNLYSVETGLYFPGLAPQHYFYLTGGYQEQHLENYYIPISRIDFPRGYQATVSEKLSSVSFNYAFNAGYPDWSVGPLLYLKRLRMNLFYDLSYGVEVREYHPSGSSYFTGFFTSTGTEILADFHLIRFIFPISAGTRLAYLPGKQKLQLEFLLNINTGIF
ncbi:MAG: hypothetical protein R6X09_06680 [Bacteroidales bacterium]